MIFSVHIPKTAGTSFRMALEERFGDRLALYYGPRDPKTDFRLRVPRGELAGRIPALKASGVEVLHGHYPLRSVAPHVAEASRQVWTWLRDPVDRVLSHYAFYRERPNDRRLAEQVRAGDLSLHDFAKTPAIRNLQSRYLEGFELRDLAFVGLTERFELGLALLFREEAPRLRRRYNATDAKVAADPVTTGQIVALNARDVQLYCEGLRLFVDRLAEAAPIKAPRRPRAAGTGLVRRLLRRVVPGG